MKEHDKMVSQPQKGIEDIGIPSRSPLFSLSHAVLANGCPGNPGMFYIPSFSTSGGYLFGINPESGESICEHIASPGGGYGCAAGADGKIYIGGIYTGNLYSYCPVSRQVENIGGEEFGVKYIFDLATARDGKIYGSCYPTCSVIEYNPATRRIKNSQALAADKEYGRSICIDQSGKIWVGIGAAGARLIVMESFGGKYSDVLPEEYGKALFAYGLYAFGKYVICSLHPGIALVFDSETMKCVRALHVPPGATDWKIAQSVQSNFIYLSASPGGELYRYDATSGNIQMMKEGPGMSKIVVADRFAHVIDDYEYVYFDFCEKKELFRRKLCGPGGGMGIHSLTQGTDGNIYGGTYINQHLFSYSPADKTLKDLGKAIRWSGQIDAIHGGRDGRIYMGSYNGAILSCYDPRKPWRPGTNIGDNPRELGKAGRGQVRVNCITLGPDNNVYMGSIGDYGSSLSGAFVCWNSSSGEMTQIAGIVPGENVLHLDADNRFIYGSGGLRPPRRIGCGAAWDGKEEDEFFIFDCATAKKACSVKLGWISSLKVSNVLNKVFLSIRDEIVIYDINKMHIETSIRNPFGALTAMASRDNGKAYGINQQAIVEINPFEGTVNILDHEGGQHLAMDKEGRLYFSRASLHESSHLLCLTVKDAL